MFRQFHRAYRNGRHYLYMGTLHRPVRHNRCQRHCYPNNNNNLFCYRHNKRLQQHGIQNGFCKCPAICERRPQRNRMYRRCRRVDRYRCISLFVVAIHSIICYHRINRHSDTNNNLHLYFDRNNNWGMC